ncbi:PucR family transcriptional regulator ligand-binding domain-containing protein [Pseudalkalibacillus hwajinpoensis]|uniref:PucR family transcriptional regulator n=1 Tax=Guptibacillus hwajinpoensis TaxID=208199 RepID=UPI00325A4D1C
MGLTVREALQLKEMREIKLIAGKKGIDRDIKWLTIVEVMEDVSRLHEGEFLITTAYGWNEKSETYTNLIEALANRQLSALAIHTGFYLDVIPIEIVEAANRIGLPLLEIPRTMNFSMVTRSILEQLVNKQLSLLAYAQRIQEDLTSLVLKNAGFSAITESLSKLLHANVSLYNSRNELVASTLLANRTSLIDARYPILGLNEQIGEIFIQKQTELSSLDHLALKQATTIFAIEFLKLQIIKDTRTQIETDFLDTLLSHSYEDEAYMLKKSKEMGFDFSGVNQVFILSSHNLDLLEQDCQQLLILNRIKGIIKKKMDHVVMLVIGAGCPISTAGGINAGISSNVHGIRKLEDAFKEATIAHLFAKYRNTPLLHYDELGAYQIFIRLKENDEELAAYYKPLLMPIVTYDEKHQSQLMKTLETFLENNLVINRTAEKLFIHRHTLNYRIKQLEKLTGIDIYSYDQRIHLQFALLAYVTDHILSK